MLPTVCGVSFILSLLATSPYLSAGNLIREICSWSGSSLPTHVNEHPSVFKVEFRCLNGYVLWKYPNGGVRMDFKSPIEAAGADFTICMALEHKAVNIYKETKSGLKLIKDYRTELSPQPICADSKDGKAVLVLEGAPSVSAPEIRLDYELEIKRGTEKKLKECAHCSLAEMIETFCHGDFAVKAHVRDRYLYDDELHLQLDLHVHHLYRQSTNIFGRVANKPFITGTVAMPSKCSTLNSRHRYVIMGYIRDVYGAYVDCHIKFAMWRMLQRYVRCDTQPRQHSLSPITLLGGKVT